jgi:hypothetical protein
MRVGLLGVYLRCFLQMFYGFTPVTTMKEEQTPGISERGRIVWIQRQSFPRCLHGAINIATHP